MVSPDPLLQTKRSGTNRIEIVRIGQHIFSLIEVLGHDAAVMGTKGKQKRRIRLLQTDDSRQFVWSLNRLDVVIGFPAAGIIFSDQILEAEFYVSRSQRHPILPFDSVAELKGVSQAVRRNLPGLGQLRVDVILFVFMDKAVIDAGRDHCDELAALEAAIQGRRIRGYCEDDDS